MSSALNNSIILIMKNNQASYFLKLEYDSVLNYLLPSSITPQQCFMLDPQPLYYGS